MKPDPLVSSSDSASAPAPVNGVVASLHLHPSESGAPFQSVGEIRLVKGTGIIGDHRYFGRKSRTTGEPSKRQVTLIEREQIAEHAAAFGLPGIAPGAVRSNIETIGLQLSAWLGHELHIGEAILFLFAPRDPCAKMDLICPGLRERMLHRKQGVLAEVIQGGRITVGDPIRVARQE